MDPNTHFGGWRQETDEMDAALPEERKFPALAAKPEFAARLTTPQTGVVDLRSKCPAVYNQYSIGSCVANAIVGDLEFLELMEGIPYTHLSRMFVYYNARLEMNETDKDDGSIISLAMGTLTKQGVASEATCPYDTGNVFLRPDWMAYRDAFAHTIVQSYKILTTGVDRHNDIQTALNAGHPVVFGTPVWNSIRGVSFDGMMPMPDSSPSIGGHAMLIVGYDLSHQIYIIRNSWGTTWGDGGYGYMPMAYLDAAGADDFWVGTKIG